jgi:hypothetical protein
MSLESQRLLFRLPPSWSPDDTEEFLNVQPLPVGFQWRLSKTSATARRGDLVAVQPSHRDLAYGKWLRETPYFQGLFELVHQLVLEAGEQLPTAEALAARLDALRAAQESANVTAQSIQ